MMGDTMHKSMKDFKVDYFVNGLKDRNEEIRNKVLKELHNFATTTLLEKNTDDISSFLDVFSKHAFQLVSSQDNYDKKSGILAIITLVGVEVPTKQQQCSRYANYIRNLLPTTDIELMELTAKAIGKVGLESGQLATSYTEYESKRAIEWLSTERNESKRHCAVRNECFNLILGSDFPIVLAAFSTS